MYDFSSLPLGSILLAPTHMHPYIQKQFAMHQKGKLGIRLFSIDNYFRAQTFLDIPDQDAILFQYHKTINKIKPTLNIYQKACLSVTFLKQCYAFVEDCKLFDINVNDLPEESDAEKELKKIMQALYDLPSSNDALQKAKELLALQSLDHVYIFESFFDTSNQYLVDFLVDHGAHMIKQDLCLEESSFYHALNKRQEVESVAQYILTHHLCADDISITISDPSYANILAQIFDRYQIPYTDLSTHSTQSSLILAVKKLLTYHLSPTQKNLCACLDVDIYQEDYIASLQQYLEIFQKDFYAPFDHLEKQTKEGHVLNARDVEKLRVLEQQAEYCRQQLAPKLALIKDPISKQALLLTILTQLQETMTKTTQQQSMFRKIYAFFQEVAEYIHNPEDLRFLLSIVENFSQHATTSTITGICITSLTQGTMARKISFLLGATQTLYPAFPTKSGIFDEKYYEKLNYPSMEVRYHQHVDQLSAFLQHAKQLIVSYPLGTYEGKSLEPALEIEQFFQKPSIAYPIKENYIPYQPSIFITREQAEQLYLKNNALQGSISSLERFVRCPFSYYLRYGLGIQEPMKLGFADSYMGTLSHHILETLTKQEGKAYTEQVQEQIETIIQEEMDALKEVFPDLSSRFQILQSRIQESILQTFDRLHDFEQHSHFKPYKEEHEFYHTIPLEHERSIHLHGFIDRIDCFDDLLCILDYKSSAKILSEKQVFAALQLQLLTYSVVMHHQQPNKKILGAYYVSLKNENIPHIAGKMSRRKPIEHISIEKEELEEERLKAHRLNGWTMQPQIEDLDDDANHITGVRINKDGIIVSSKLYNIDTIESYLHTMYQDIANRILAGDNRLEPCENACMFCAFHEICHFRGMPFKRDAIIEPDDLLYWTGDENDDEI